MSIMQMLTVNANGDGWVDAIPTSDVTGYGHQNTNIAARNLGIDLSSFKIEGINIVAEVSGPVDVNGVPFVIKEEEILIPAAVGDYYVEIVPGASATEKDLALTKTAPVWDPIKNAFYSTGGNRVINKVFSYDGTDTIIYRLGLRGEERLYSKKSAPGPDGVPTWKQMKYLSWGSVTRETLVSNSSVFEGAVMIGDDLVVCLALPSPQIIRFWGVSINLQDQFVAPGLNPSGLSYHDGDLISSDNVLGKVYVHDGFSDTIKSTIDVDLGITGVTVFDGDLVACYGLVDIIKVYDGLTNVLKTSFPSPSSYPRGLETDGVNLISCDFNSKKVYVHDGLSQRLLTSFPAYRTDVDVVGDKTLVRPTAIAYGNSTYYPDTFFSLISSEVIGDEFTDIQHRT